MRSIFGSNMKLIKLLENITVCKYVVKKTQVPC